MSRDVKVIGPEKTIKEAARMMRDGNFGMLPVETRITHHRDAEGTENGSSTNLSDLCVSVVNTSYRVIGEPDDLHGVSDDQRTLFFGWESLMQRQGAERRFTHLRAGRWRGGTRAVPCQIVIMNHVLGQKMHFVSE